MIIYWFSFLSSDYRFASQTNQEPYCWTRFNEFLLCAKKHGSLNDSCVNKYLNLLSVCPQDYVCNFHSLLDMQLGPWNDKIEEGTFLGVRSTPIPVRDGSYFGPRFDEKVKEQLIQKGVIKQ